MRASSSIPRRFSAMLMAMSAVKKYLVLGGLLAVPILLAVGSQSLTRAPGDPAVPRTPIVVTPGSAPAPPEGAGVEQERSDDATVDEQGAPAPDGAANDSIDSTENVDGTEDTDGTDSTEDIDDDDSD